MIARCVFYILELTSVILRFFYMVEFRSGNLRCVFAIVDFRSVILRCVFDVLRVEQYSVTTCCIRHIVLDVFFLCTEGGAVQCYDVLY